MTESADDPPEAPPVPRPCYMDRILWGDLCHLVPEFIGPWPENAYGDPDFQSSVTPPTEGAAPATEEANAADALTGTYRSTPPASSVTMESSEPETYAP